MTPDEHRELAARVLEKNKGVVGLFANPDFQDWLELVPKAELKLLIDRIVGVDRSTKNWRELVCDSVIEYQGIYRAIIDLTKIRVQAAEKARKDLKDLDKK